MRREALPGLNPGVCGEPHPDGSAVCDKAVPCRGYHADAAADLVWGYTPLPEPEWKQRRKRGDGRTKAALAEIAQRAER